MGKRDTSPTRSPLESPTLVSVRHMIRRDSDEVLAIDAECYRNPLDESQLVELLRQRNCIGMVAENDPSRILGYMIYSMHAKAIGVERLGVAPHARRHGVGSSLIYKLQNKLTMRRRTSIEAIVSDHNLVAHKFLHRNGFRAEILRDWFDNGDGYLFTYQITGD